MRSCFQLGSKHYFTTGCNILLIPNSGVTKIRCVHNTQEIKSVLAKEWNREEWTLTQTLLSHCLHLRVEAVTSVYTLGCSPCEIGSSSSIPTSKTVLLSLAEEEHCEWMDGQATFFFSNTISLVSENVDADLRLQFCWVGLLLFKKITSFWGPLVLWPSKRLGTGPRIMKWPKNMTVEMSHSGIIDLCT